MGNCERELDPTPPDWWHERKLWDYLEEKWGAILRDMMELKICGAALKCGREFSDQLTIELPKCAPEFYKLCDFDRLIRICPFDPAWDAFDWRQEMVSERLQALEVQVKELQAKV